MHSQEENVSLTGKQWKENGKTNEALSLYENILAMQNKSAADFTMPQWSDFISPFEFQDMKKAVQCVEECISEKKRILIFGDYDLDGMSGTAQLYLTLKLLGAQVSYRLPSRADGYGLSLPFIDEAHSNDVALFITTDCGVSNATEIDHAKKLGMKFIVTDHHSVPETLPNADAILHPLVETERFSDRDLTGAGVAWYFCRAMLQSRYGEKHSEAMEKELLEIAMLGTIADCGSLIGENRKIVMMGLEKIKTSSNTGLKKLIEVSKSDINTLTAETIAFFIAPRLNASGRLAHPKISLELLLGDAEKANELEELNVKRQQMVEGFLEEAYAQLEDQEDSPALLVGSENWPGGIIGLISGRLAEQSARPCIAFEIQKNKITGSCRGPLDFHIANALKEIKNDHPEYFFGCGGHAQAAGLSLHPEYFEDFCREYKTYVQEKRGATPPLPSLSYFGEITNSITVSDIQELQSMQPFGIGNPFPCFRFSNMSIVSSKAVGSDYQHLSMFLASPFPEQKPFSAIWFREGKFFDLLQEGVTVDILAVPEVQVWQGKEKISLKIMDVFLGE